MDNQYRMAEAFTRSWVFGAIRYSTVGAVSMVEIFGLAVYVRVGTVKQIAGITLGRDKAGE